MALKKVKLGQYFRNNMTKPEVLLWLKIQNDQLGFRFKRQYSFGNYVLDFYRAEFMVAVEVDGMVHLLREKKDAERDRFLESEGVTVLRYSAKAVLKNPYGVAQDIREKLLELQTRNA